MATKPNKGPLTITHPNLGRDLLHNTIIGSIGATVFLSIAGSLAANTDRPPSHDNYPHTHSTGSFNTPVGHLAVGSLKELGGQDVLPGPGEVNALGIRIDASGSLTRTWQENGGDWVERVTNKHTKVEARSQLMEWARLFGNDPEAKKTLNGKLGIDQTVSNIRQLRSDGWTINGIVLDGHASDEDDTAWKNGGANPGLGIPNQKNSELAAIRRDAVSVLLGDELNAAFGPEIAKLIRAGEAKEIIDAAQITAINDLAAKLEMSPQQLTVGWNRQFPSLLKRLSSDDKEILMSLNYNRRVDIVIEASKTETVLVYKEAEDRWVKETRVVDIKLVVIPATIPFLPLPGKRRQGETTITPTKPPTKSPDSSANILNQKSIGDTRPGFGREPYHNKQPTRSNNGSKESRYGNAVHKPSKYDMRKQAGMGKRKPQPKPKPKRK